MPLSKLKDEDANRHTHNTCYHNSILIWLNQEQRLSILYPHILHSSIILHHCGQKHLCNLCEKRPKGAHNIFKEKEDIKKLCPGVGFTLGYGHRTWLALVYLALLLG